MQEATPLPCHGPGHRARVSWSTEKEGVERSETEQKKVKLLEFGERDMGDMQESLTPQFCQDSWGLSAHPVIPEVLSQHLKRQQPLGTNRLRQIRGETHLALNTAPEPEVPPWLGQESWRPLFLAQVFPLAPAAAGSQTLRSCQGSGGWLLGAGSTAAGPGTAPSAPTWNREKGMPILLRPGWPGSSPHCSGCGEEHRWAGSPTIPAMAPAMPHPC